MKKLEKGLFVGVVVLIVVLLGLKYMPTQMMEPNPQNQQQENAQTVVVQPTVVINGTVFIVEVADDTIERTTGLSEHESLEDKRGILFVFESMGDHRFWMKGMSFPIDMIWINDELEIIHIEEDVRPESYPTPYGTDRESLFVLEVPALSVSKYDIRVGDTVEMNIPEREVKE